MGNKKRGRPAIYDWKKLGDGKEHTCIQGVDFQTPVASFRALVHRTANARGQRATTRIKKGDPDRVSFFFHD